jgi:hypothetical protein
VVSRAISTRSVELVSPDTRWAPVLLPALVPVLVLVLVSVLLRLVEPSLVLRFVAAMGVS